MCLMSTNLGFIGACSRKVTPEFPTDDLAHVVPVPYVELLLVSVTQQGCMTIRRPAINTYSHSSCQYNQYCWFLCFGPQKPE